MLLVHFDIEFEFNEATRLRTPAHKVFDAFSGKLRGPEPREPGTNIRDEKQKFTVNWKYERCRIVLEETEDWSKCISTLTKLLEIINNVVPFGKLQNTNVDTEWILPAEKHDFTSLNEIYMRTFISPKDFMRDTYDSSIVLDSKIDDFILHHQSGPMMRKQLSEDYLVFKRPNLPAQLIFLLVGARYTKVIQYSKEEIQRLVTNAFNLCERHSNKFGEIWEDYL